MKKTIIAALIGILFTAGSNAADRPITHFICSKKDQLAQLLLNNPLTRTVKSIASNPYTQEIKEFSVEAASGTKSNLMIAASWSRQHKVKSILIAIALYEVYKVLRAAYNHARGHGVSKESFREGLNAMMSTKLLKTLWYFLTMKEFQTLIKNYVLSKIGKQ
jgi:hypothetical protein